MPDDDDRHRQSPRPAAIDASAVQDIPADTILSLAETQGPTSANRTPVDGESHGHDRYDILDDVTEAELSANHGGHGGDVQHANGHGQQDGADRNPATVEQTPLSSFDDLASVKNSTNGTRFDGLFGQPSTAAQKGLVGWSAVLADLGIKKEESEDNAKGVGKHWDLIRKKRSTAVQKNAVWKSHTIDTATVRSK
eukprot:1032627-Rhodomonas_salina.2